MSDLVFVAIWSIPAKFWDIILSLGRTVSMDVQHGRSAWTVSMDGSVIELIDNNLFHVGLVLNDGLLVYSVSLSYWILTYITYIKKYNIYMVISLLSSWPKLSHRNSVSISSSEFVNHLCKQQWNEYSSSSDSDLFTSISLISD